LLRNIHPQNIFEQPIILLIELAYKIKKTSITKPVSRVKCPERTTGWGYESTIPGHDYEKFYNELEHQAEMANKRWSVNSVLMTAH
jgi:hypothetical protein